VVGEKASVSGESHIAPNCEIGANALVHDSFLREGVVVVGASSEGTPTMRDQFRADWTVVARSQVGTAAMIGANAQIEKSIIGAGATIGDRSDLENVTVDLNEVVPADTVRLLEEEPETIEPTPAESDSASESNLGGTSLIQRLRARVGLHSDRNA
jgi:NDP-sugar pyrophosphorylase family protein